MAEANDILKQIKNVWAKLGPGQKVAAGGISALVFAGVLAAALLGGNPDYKQLIGQVAPNDLSGIISQLEDLGVSDYKIIAQNSIHVKSSDYEMARRALYQTGTLPNKGTDESDSGLFSGSGGMSRDERAHTRILKTEKRLEKTLRALDYIEVAKVTITGKRKSFFKGGKEQAKAMVTIKTRGVLSKEQVWSVAYTVSSGVQSLSADAVTVSNTMGQVLKRPSSGDETGDQESRLAYQKQLEQNKTMTAQRILDQVHGPNKVLIALNVDLDWTRSNKIQKTFDSAGKIVREKTTTESTTPVSSSRAGGAVGNNALQGSDDNKKQEFAKDSSKKEMNDYGFTEEKIVTMGGAITRMTASVFVDESLEGKKDELLRTVAGAIGLDETRGDKIEVLVTKIEGFKPIDIGNDVTAVETKETIMFYVEKGIYLLIGLAFVFFALRTVKKAQSDLRGVLEASLEEEQREEPVAPLTLEEEVLETAVGDTELAARSLRRWLYEGAGAAE